MRPVLAVLAVVLGLSSLAYSQELYPLSKPASNMPSGSLSYILNTKVLAGEGAPAYRFQPELAYGVGKLFMLHGTLFFSDVNASDQRFEGGSLFGQVRFLSQDAVHEHFRMAAYGRFSATNKPLQGPRVNLLGEHSGLELGVVATKLVNKFAVAGRVSYVQLADFRQGLGFVSAHAWQYNLSLGLLLLPKTYETFEETNLNVYVEFIGGALELAYAPTDETLRGGIPAGSYLDIAPSVQLIFNSQTRLSLAYRTPIAGNQAALAQHTVVLILNHLVFGAFR